MSGQLQVSLFSSINLIIKLVFAAIIAYGCFAITNYAQAEGVQEKNLPPTTAPILNRVIEDAQQSAQQDYEIDDHDLDDGLKSMKYQQYRAIRFNADKSLWRNQHDYEVQFFHPGFLYQQPITVVTVDKNNEETTLPFKNDSFYYDKGAEQFAGLTNDKSGYAGFRLHYPLKTDEYKDEFAVFLGASYFRLIGKDHVYGISARGLAIDTGLAKGEEFPHFTKFWLVEPEDGEPITIYARLESPSVSGAYKFVLQPGAQTRVDVDAWLFAREDVTKLGLAPFTSMFLYGENSNSKPDDYRPEVHDSDGVSLIMASGEQIWRPLTNPTRLQITSLNDTGPQGFGMLQRDTHFANYLDAEANYHQRPGLWVTPKAGFEEGRLELVEIPTKSEIHDNIVAYWIPNQAFNAGESRYLAYTLETVTGSPENSSLAEVISTHQGRHLLPGDDVDGENELGTRRFVVDFSLPDALLANVDKVSVSVSSSHGKVQQAKAFAVNNSKVLRATFLLTPEESTTADMRLFITVNDKRVSEVWNYVYQAK
jgi:glucans biosynthesis protein